MDPYREPIRRHYLRRLQRALPRTLGRVADAIYRLRGSRESFPRSLAQIVTLRNKLAAMKDDEVLRDYLLKKARFRELVLLFLADSMGYVKAERMEWPQTKQMEWLAPKGREGLGLVLIGLDELERLATRDLRAQSEREV